MEKEITKREFSYQEIRDMVINLSKSNLQSLQEKLKNELLPKFNKESQIDPEIFKITREKLAELALALSLDSGQALVESLGEQYKNLALEMKESLETEFECSMPSGKALVDITVNAYIKKLSYSQKMEGIQNSTGPKHNNYLNYLSREVDRAHRQFISGIEALKFMKQPPLKISLNANSAYIGENQQFNNSTQINENNKPK